MKYSLRPTGWALLVSLLLFLSSLVLIAKVNAYRAFPAIAAVEFQQEEILVTIDGAVKKPGQYTVYAGSTVGQLVRKAKPTGDANLQALPLKEILDGPRHIVVEELKEIRVFVEGAIAEPVEVVLPPKSRISDLKSKVNFTDETEKTFFRRRKLLKNGDKIVVPKKTVE
jgi:protein involved in polysaccharide export with SLBB domain